MKRLTALLLCIACALSLAGCANVPNGTLAAPEYPEMAPYPSEDEFRTLSGEFEFEKYMQANDAYAETLERQRRYGNDCTGMEGYFTAATQTLLADASGENLVYSPVNLYLALGMLAEITDGQSRGQILSLLGEDSVEDVRLKSHALFNACYRDTGATTSLPASSIWLQDGYPYHGDVLNTLAGDYYASAFSGEMGSGEYTKQLRNWLNENTGGLLSDACEGIELSRDTRMALATTLYFCARWSDEFHQTEQAEFRLPGGSTTECDFMRQSRPRSYYWGESFSAVKQDFLTGGGMWFLLPDEGVSVEDLIAGGEAMDFLLSDGEWENSKHLIVHLSVPKFDVSSTLDLSEGMKALGIRDVFDAAVSDFSPLTDETLYLSNATHAARVKINEEGCEAAAFTVMMTAGAVMPPSEEVDLTLDRPFLFAIMSDTGLPLFIGVVNSPV